MGKMRLGSDEIKSIAVFENMTGAIAKDCINYEDAIGFLVREGDMGLAIGKNGNRIEKVQEKFGKHIWVVEFSSDKIKFIKNLFQPVRIRNVKIYEAGDGGESTAIVEARRRDQRMVKDKTRLNIAKELAKRHYNMNLKVNIK